MFIFLLIMAVFPPPLQGPHLPPWTDAEYEAYLKETLELLKKEEHRKMVRRLERGYP